MKFFAQSITEPKALHIDAFSEGIISTDGARSKALADCKNVWFKDGAVRSREGLFTTDQRWLDDTPYAEALSYDYYPIPLVINYDGSDLQLVGEYIEGDGSAHVCLTHFVGTDGVSRGCAELGFYRVDDSTFYIPHRISFFKGAPQEGCGVYALVSLVNCEHFTEHESRIYELSADLSTWDRTVATYTPTVYINGRGNRYEIVKDTGQAYTGTPTRLEGLNLLDSEFYAYYSTDGRSSSFRLPFSDIDNDSVRCRYYESVSDYVEWIIPKGASSGKATVDGTEVTMHVNREKGIVYFRVPAGDYEVPLVEDRNENNLRFSAHKSCDYGLWELSCAQRVLSDKGKIFLAYENVVFAADYENPLYFPAQSYVKVGENDAHITALRFSGERVAVFKNFKTYLLSYKEGRALNSISLLAENDSIFYSGDTLSQKCISYGKGCFNDSEIIGKDEYLCWRGSDGGFYALFKGEEKTVNLSSRLNGYIKGNFGGDGAAFGIDLGEYCLFGYGNKALVFQITDKSGNAAFYSWEFPEELRAWGGFNLGGRPMLICKAYGESLAFIANLEGESDCYISGGPYENEVIALPVSSLVRTGNISLDCKNALSCINSVTLSIKTKNAVVRLKDRPIATVGYGGTDGFKSVEIRVGLCAVNNFDLAVESKAGFCLGEVDIKYTPLGAKA